MGGAGEKDLKTFMCTGQSGKKSSAECCLAAHQQVMAGADFMAEIRWNYSNRGHFFLTSLYNGVPVDAAILNLRNALALSPPLSHLTLPPTCSAHPLSLLDSALCPHLLMSSTATGALQWGNNVAVKQRGCDPSFFAHPLSPDSGIVGAVPTPFPFPSLCSKPPPTPPRLGLETDSFSPQHLICGNRCSTAAPSEGKMPKTYPTKVLLIS